MSNGAPTMKDVAREAGVALGTVSKVINGIPVGDSYRIKVEQAAHKLGYQVNQYARGLKTNKTYTVAVILPSVDHPFFSALAQHLCKVLTLRGYRMLLYLSDYDQRAEQECIRTIRQQKADGIIGLTYNPDLEIGDDIPFVTIDRCFGKNVPCVSSDNYGGGRIAAEKLMELGCKHLAFLRTGSLEHSEVDKRGDGFESACRSRRKKCEICWLNDGEDITLFKEFFLQHTDENGKLAIDGIGCSTDLVAWQVKGILTELGHRVPEDVQIIGYDGLRMFSTEDPFCSSIAQPVQEIAETCVRFLLDTDRVHLPSLVCLPVSYVPGGTTKEPFSPKKG